MATPYDFMTRESGGNTYATGATRQANPYATPQTGPNAQQGMIRQPTQAQQTTNPQTGSSANQTFSLYGGSNQPQQQQASATTFNPNGPGRPGTSRYGPVTEANSFAAWNAQRPWGQQYGVAGTPGAYAVPQQSQPQPNGGNVGGTYQQPQQQSNPYGVDTSMGGGADPIRYGGVRGPAPTYNPGTGAPSRSLQTQQYSGAPSQGSSAQPTTRPTQNPQQQGQSAQPTTRPATVGQQQPQYSQPQYSGQTSPNPDPYGSPWVDYINADGSPHINYQYGQNSGGGGQRGPTGPNPGSDTYWQNPNAILNPQGAQQPGRIPVGGYPAQNGHGPMPMPAMSTGQVGPNGQPNLSLPFDWAQYSAARNDNPRIAQEYAQLYAPYAQMQQNAYQYTNDYAESVRRDDRNFGLSQQGQQWDQGMQNRQQTEAERIARVGEGQWGQQFQHQVGNDLFNRGMSQAGFDRDGRWHDAEFDRTGQWADRQFALDQTNQNNQYGLDRDRFGLAQTQANWGQQNAQQSLYYQGQDQSLRELDSQRNYGLAQNAQGLQAQQLNQDYGVALRDMTLRETGQQQQYGLQQASQVMQREQLAHQMGIDTRGMSLQELQHATQSAFQQQQLAQQGTLSREQMASQERMATMAATGRQQAPSAKWVRSW
jgi:hypothetical protein